MYKYSTSMRSFKLGIKEIKSNETKGAIHTGSYVYSWSMLFIDVTEVGVNLLLFIDMTEVSNNVNLVGNFSLVVDPSVYMDQALLPWCFLSGL